MHFSLCLWDYSRFKRLSDFLLALCGLLVLSPLLIFLTCLVYQKLGSPVFFFQVRPGLHGKPFRMVKFRTLSDPVGADGLPLSDAERMSPFGRFLRASSLDELPELWNVIVGDMSLVGPRPLLMDYIPLYTPFQARRHQVTPGITGLAQINGRNAISWEQRFRFDVWYVDNQSFWLDLTIFLRTIVKVIRREGISAAGEATMNSFQGSPFE